MPHALAVRHVSVSDAERAQYLASLATRRAQCTARGAHLWAFEREGVRGEFVEFVETRDRDTLGTAIDDAGIAGAAIYLEIVPDITES